MTRTTVALLASLTLLFVGACSSDDSDSTTTTVADSTSALAPIEVDGADDIAIQVGEFIRVNTPGADKVSTDAEAVLETEDAYSDGSADFVPGAEAIGDGTAVLSVFEGDDLLYEVNVTVEG